MRALLFAGLFVATPAIGADFRGTEFGSTCAAIEDREKALGSELIPASMSTGPGYRFNGRAFDRDVLIIYLCKDGVFKLGDYHFPNKSHDDAVADYIAAYGKYSAEYGSPTLVYSKPGTSPVFPTVGAATPSEYHASWHVDELVVHVDFMLDRHGTGANWFVMVVTSQHTK